MRTFFAALCAACLTAPANGQPAAQPGLPPAAVLALNATGTPYHGVRTLSVANGQPLAQEIWHQGVWTRIEFRSGKATGRIVVESPDVRQEFDPKNNEIRTVPSVGQEVIDELRKVLRAAAKRGLVGERNGGLVAGRPTRLVSIARPGGRVILESWVDADTGVVVRRRRYGPLGGVVSAFEYQRIEYPPSIPKERFSLDAPNAKRVSAQDELRDAATRAGFRPLVLTPQSGYQLERARVMNIGGNPILMQTYVGKPGRLSLFQVRGPLDAERLRRSANPRFNAYAWSRRGWTFALVGRAPASELERLARSLGAP